MRMHVSICVLVLWLGTGTSAGDVAALPPNLIVSAELDGVVAKMLRRSPTFRDQRDRLRASPRVRVQLRLDWDPARRSDRTRAQCDMVRHEFGALVATIRIWSRPDAVELIAHELEHVLEWAEGTDFQTLSVRRPRDVWTVAGGQFETARAISTGTKVKFEVARNHE